MVRLSSLLFALLLVPLAFLLGGHSPGTGKPVTVLQILTGYGAKEACSCVFVVGQTDAYCTDLAQTSGYTVDVTIDHNAKVVTAAYGTITRTAHAGPAGTGCMIDTL